MAEFGHYDWRRLEGSLSAPEKERFEQEEKMKRKWSRLTFNEKLKYADIHFESDIQLLYQASHFFSSFCGWFSFQGFNISIYRLGDQIPDKVYKGENMFSGKDMEYDSNTKNDFKLYLFQLVFMEIEKIGKGKQNPNENLKAQCESITRKMSFFCQMVHYYHENNASDYTHYHNVFWSHIYADLKEEYNKLIYSF